MAFACFYFYKSTVANWIKCITLPARVSTSLSHFLPTLPYPAPFPVYSKKQEWIRNGYIKRAKDGYLSAFGGTATDIIAATFAVYIPIVKINLTEQNTNTKKKQKHNSHNRTFVYILLVLYAMHTRQNLYTLKEIRIQQAIWGR